MKQNKKKKATKIKTEIFSQKTGIGKCLRNKLDSDPFSPLTPLKISKKTLSM